MCVPSSILSRLSTVNETVFACVCACSPRAGGLEAFIYFKPWKLPHIDLKRSQMLHGYSPE